MKKYLVKYYRKNNDTNDYDVVGSITMFYAGLKPLAAQIFLASPNDESRKADRISWEIIASYF